MSQTKKYDLEQNPTEENTAQCSTTQFDLEYRIPTGTKLAYLSVYFLCNISLTIYNKAVLGKVRKSSDSRVL